jgi:hypothetical protein
MRIIYWFLTNRTFFVYLSDKYENKTVHLLYNLTNLKMDKEAWGTKQNQKLTTGAAVKV